jgi:ATP-binding cassette subfamily F protein 3
MAAQPVGSMSGGEKARLVLCMIVWQRPNLLLLDEPTNHLDLATREALSVALNEFEGTVMLVSHDRALLRTVCDEFWLVSRGGVAPFDGDLDDYQRYLLEEARRVREAAQAAGRAPEAAAARTPAGAGGTSDAQAASRPPAASGPALSAAEQRRLDAQRRQQQAARTRPIRREIETLDARMAQLQAGIAALAEQLAGPMPPAEIADAGRRLKAMEAELADAETRWLELNETLESLEG